MAFAPWVRARALVSALGMLRQTTRPLTLDMVVARIRRDYDPFNRQSFFTVYNLVRSADLLLERGRDVGDDPTRRFGARVLPSDPSITGNQRRYRYRVVVEEADATGGRGHSAMIVVNSSSPLTGEEALDQAMEQYRREEVPDEYERVHGIRSQQNPIYAFVITAGQRP